MTKTNDNGNIRDMTAEEQAVFDARQTAWANDKPNRQLKLIKEVRIKYLKETDWWALRGSISDTQKNFRQKLRDIPADYDSSKYDELLAKDSNNKLTHSVWSKPSD